jgi:hypothetical protein
VREALEECGLVVRVGVCVSRAARASILPGHETLWLGPARAAQILKHDSQMWAVRDWMKFRGAP